MKLLYKFKILSLILYILSFFIKTTLGFASGELAVTGVYRLSHPAYYMLDYAYGDANSVNASNTKILMWEHNGSISLSDGTSVTFPSHPYWPQAATSGRGTIWGDITALKACDFDNLNNMVGGNAGLTCWANATHDLLTRPTGVTTDYLGNYPKWSPYPGEENILYGICLRNDKQCNGLKGHLVKIDTDKSEGESGYITDVVYIADPNTYPYMDVHSFTTTGKVIINHRYLKNPNNFGSTGAIVTLAPSVSIESYDVTGNPCQPSWTQAVTSIHHGTGYLPEGSFDATATPNNYDSSYVVIYDCDNSNYWWRDYTGTSKQLSGYTWSRISSSNSPNWYIASNYNQNTIYRGIIPHIERHQLIDQVIFNAALARQKPNNHDAPVFTHNVLIDRPTASNWAWDKDGNGYDNSDAYRLINYTGIAHPTLSYDNTVMVFNGTNGKYSSMDKGICNLTNNSIQNCSSIGDNWEGNGVYIAELTPASGAQTCTSFTYAAWSECQPNNTQTRTVISSSPAGCTGGTPVLEQSCSYTGTSLHNLLKATSNPVIDGNLGEYALAESLNFSPSSGGNTVTVKTLWDAEALYFGIEVADTQLNASVTTRDGSVWSEDSIEWFIDTYNDGGSSNLNSPYMRPDDYQGIVNIINGIYDSQGTLSGTPTSTWNGSWQSAVKLNGTNNNNSDIDIGYKIEIKIPWTSIGYTSAPSADTIVGMGFAINDKDSSSFSSLMWPNLYDIANQNASNWQMVTLSGSFALVDSMPPKPPVALMVQ